VAQRQRREVKIWAEKLRKQEKEGTEMEIGQNEGKERKTEK
jgi:hypothetical protein